MEKPLIGTILCEDVPRSRTVRGFIEKRISRWLSPKVPTQHATYARYLVRLRREGEGHWIHCQVEINWGEHTWVSAESASGLHQAVLRCLERIRYLENPPLQLSSS